MKIGLIIAVFVVAFLAIVAYSTFNGPRYRAQVCMSYKGRQTCRTVSAKSEAGALRSGAENACADITSGVTDIMQCGQTEPRSVRWLERPH